MRIAVGSDHRGKDARPKLVELLGRLGHDVDDCGTFDDGSVDYPEIAEMVGHKIGRGEVDRGILICGTGLGMCIAANKCHGVRAAPIHDELAAEISRRHNDLNVLCLAADLLGEAQTDRMVEIWLNTPFDAGRHQRRIAKISALDEHCAR